MFRGIEGAFHIRLTARRAGAGLAAGISHQLGEILLAERRKPADGVAEFGGGA